MNIEPEAQSKGENAIPRFAEPGVMKAQDIEPKRKAREKMQSLASHS